MNRRFAIALCVLAWLVPRIVTSQVTADRSREVLEPGDLLRITVWQRPEFSGEFIVAPDGSITHPLYRTVQVADVPLPEAEGRVRQFLTQFVAQPAFSFSPLFRVFVGGEVRQPNTLTLPPGTTVAQAIALSGGPTGQANATDVRVLRADRTIAIDLTNPDGASARTTIRSGDQIVVGRRGPGFREAIAPVASVVAALAGIASIIVQLRK